MSKYLKPITSARLRALIRKEAVRRGFTMGRMNAENREALAEACFSIENEREHAKGPRDPQVVLMRQVRNALYDALGFNEALPKVRFSASA